MPQCQESRVILGPVQKVADHCWRCPGYDGCRGGECYVEVTTESWARKPFTLALREAQEEFERSSPEVRLWSGVFAQTVLAPDGVADVYLHPTARLKSRPAQIAYQASHEAAHVVCGPSTIHWTHELVAVRFSLDHLARHGLQSFADRHAHLLIEKASTFSTSDLLAWDPDADEGQPEGLYGRAYVLGSELVDDVGWPAVRRLTLWPHQTVDQWLESLPPTGREAATRTLGL